MNQFARKFKELAESVKDHCFLIMRAYIEKPRTRQGWKGIVHDPHLNGSHDISCGLQITRSLLVELAEMEIGLATEFLTPHLAPYIEDLISWGCIGALLLSSTQTPRLLPSHANWVQELDRWEHRMCLKRHSRGQISPPLHAHLR